MAAGLSGAPPSLTYALVQARLEEAVELKQEGNDLFRRSKWIEALQSYRNGLAQLPKRRHPPSPSPRPPSTDEEGDPPPAEEETGASTDAEPAGSDNVDSSLERECAKARSVLHANIAACHVKLASAHAHNLRAKFNTHLLQGENEDAVKACTEGSLWAL